MNYFCATLLLIFLRMFGNVIFSYFLLNLESLRNPLHVSYGEKFQF